MRLAVVASHPIQYHAPLFRELAQRFDLTVFFAHCATPSDQAMAGFGVEFAWDLNLLEGYKYVFLKNIAKRPRIDRFDGCDTPEIATHLTQGQFDAVLVQGWHLKAYLQAAYAARRLGIALLVRGDSQLDTPRSPLKKLTKAVIYPAFLRVYDAALYVGKRSRAYYRHFHYPTERLFFSPHCVDTEWFSARATTGAGSALRAAHGIACETKVLLFAGKLVAFKRPLDLVAAAEICRVRGTQVEIMIAGDGPLAGDVLEAASAAGVPVHCLGFCNQTKMPSVYAASDILVLPSDGNETWGLVANEALACRRPIILSDAVGAAPDLADDPRVGLTFPVANVSAMAAAIEKMLASPESHIAIYAKSQAYCVAAAVDGIETALSALTSRKMAARK